MAQNVLVVESPAKAKTIKKYLGKGFDVFASYGHVRDLVPKEGAVKPEANFAMRYAPIAKNSRHVDQILQALIQSEALYLATDPDREGEAISWHLCEMLAEKGALAGKTVHRVVFHEITPKAIQEAIAHPRTIATDLVNAQQARRALDYLVGFNLSPLLWKKIRKGLSAGRVQSPALRLIVTREAEIDAFVPQEYWTIQVPCHRTTAPTHATPFEAKLLQYHGEKVSQFTFTQADTAQAATETLQAASQGFFTVHQIQKKQRKRQSAPPFITSTLQQEAAKRLGFTAQRTMRVAQQLYEGIDVGEGTTGLITYMRTDSVHLSQDALQEIRSYIQEHEGLDYLPEKPRVFTTTSKNAQEAHEAIRPTSIHREPHTLKHHLSDEQFKLYQLIWQRTLASQMTPALFDTVAVQLAMGQGDQVTTDHLFKANGSTLVFPGFLKVWQDSAEDQPAGEDGPVTLPPLAVGDVVAAAPITPTQHFTEPPPRYNEASLVKALEEYGIGRPSTYATIIATLQQREYVTLDQKKFRPTDMGCVVSDFLSQYFNQYVDYDFTAHLEDELDAVSRGERDWHQILHHFWEPFQSRVDHVGAHVSRQEVTRQPTGEDCPQCGKPLMLQLGRRSRFIGCSAYPECDYTRATQPEPEADPSVIADRACPQCGGALKIKKGPYSAFIGCSKYPTCRFSEPLEKPKVLEVSCPSCHTGQFTQRKSKRGKVFYACNRYPTCSYATWDPPVAKPCPQCQWPILTCKTTQRSGSQYICPQKCGYQAPAGSEDA